MLVVATMEKLSELMAYLAQELKNSPFEAKIKKQIELAVEEALVNIITYAYPKKPTGKLEMTCNSLNNKGISITMRDWGIPFNPLDKKNPNLESSLEERPIGGLGIFFIRSVMDEVHYKRDGDSNILQMKKLITEVHA